MKLTTQTKAIVLVAVVLLLGGVVLGLNYLAVRGTYELTCEAEFGVLPTDDVALEKWLRSQPGMKYATVSRSGSTVRVNYKVKPSGTVPDLDQQFADHGYLDKEHQVTAIFDGR